MNLEEIINLAFKKVMGKKPTQKGSSFTQRQQDKEQLTQQGYNPMTGKFTESFTDKYDDNPELKGKQSKLPDALQKAIINKTNEHHLKGNPNAKYVAVYGGSGWFDVWEGEPFDETGENGVLVSKFGSLEDAKEYANTKNAEQGKLEEEEKEKEEYQVRSKEYWDKLASRPPTHPSHKRDRRYKKLMKNK